MQEAAIAGDILPWRDVLHDGPVPDSLTLDELSQIRIQFIIERGWGTPEKIKDSFVERDQALQSFKKYSKIILWFEHDLYDQLQMLQILDWFSSNPLERTQLALICTDQYLGTLTPDEMKGLVSYEEPVTQEHIMLASQAWSAFRSSSPEMWCELLNTDTSVLPFLQGAIIRQLEEYPDCSNGLSRTAQQALEIISKGEKRPGKIFGLYQDTEARRFLGDSSFWVILHELLASNPPLLELPEGKELTLPSRPDQELTITAAGRDVLAGKRDWLEIVALDRWIGGVHLTSDNIWCWNPSARSLAKRA